LTDLVGDPETLRAKRKRKWILIAFVVSILFMIGGVCLYALGYIRWSGPRYIDNEPLRDPQKVIAVNGMSMTLEGGRLIEIHVPDNFEKGRIDSDPERIAYLLERSKYLVEVRPGAGNGKLWLAVKLDRTLGFEYEPTKRAAISIVKYDLARWYPFPLGIGTEMIGE